MRIQSNVTHGTSFGLATVKVLPPTIKQPHLQPPPIITNVSTQLFVHRPSNNPICNHHPSSPTSRLSCLSTDHQTTPFATTTHYHQRLHSAICPPTIKQPHLQPPPIITNVSTQLFVHRPSNNPICNHHPSSPTSRLSCLSTDHQTTPFATTTHYHQRLHSAICPPTIKQPHLQPPPIITNVSTQLFVHRPSNNPICNHHPSSPTSRLSCLSTDHQTTPFATTTHHHQRLDSAVCPPTIKQPHLQPPPIITNV